MRIHRSLVRPALVVAAATALCAAAVGTAAAAATANAPTTTSAHSALPSYAYYLALGDSLAAGYQPNATTGVGYLSGRGYADDLAYALRAVNHHLDYVNLGCPGETTTSMLDGGCPWPERYTTQIGAATAFLAKHRDAKILVTLDIGANDIDSCASSTGIDVTCLTKGIATLGSNLPVILKDLRAAAGPRVTIVGMNYYDPFLAYWLTGTTGQAIATASVALAGAFNGVIGADYLFAGVPVADVSSAFDTSALLPLVPFDGTEVPLDVARICAWTWMCAPAPVGPNIHANDEGYRVIFHAFRAVLPR